MLFALIGCAVAQTVGQVLPGMRHASDVAPLLSPPILLRLGAVFRREKDHDAAPRRDRQEANVRSQAAIKGAWVYKVSVSLTKSA